MMGDEVVNRLNELNNENKELKQFKQLVFDLIDKNFNPQIKAGKDMLSASVFISVCFNIVLWVVMLL